jgi:hypothetical protein
MKQLLYILSFIFVSVSVFGQTDSLIIGNNCANQLDTTEIIKIAEMENAWWDKKNWNGKTLYSIYPKIFFDEQNCEWKVHSVKAKQTKKGKCDLSGRNCRESSGCAVSTSITLVIDASTKEVKSKKKKKSRQHLLRVE